MAGERRLSRPPSRSLAGKRLTDSKSDLRTAICDHGEQHYLLRLYVTGMTPTSGLAIERVRGVCDAHLQGRYELQVIDIYQLPALARELDLLVPQVRYGYTDRFRFTCAKAERELGYTYGPLEPAIADALAWFRAHGML